MAGIFIITDTHLGARSNSIEWMDIMQETHDNFIIPTIKENVKDGDLIVHCGDLFDNRSSVNVKAIDIAIKSYENLAKIAPLHILAGNHDIYYKNSTEITSIDILKWVPNINIYKEPEILYYGDSKILMMPWRENIKEESETLKKFSDEFGCDYAFMHGTFSLIKYNKYVDIDKEDGVNPTSANAYKRVVTGHIHWRQERGNILIAGTPYQITRGDSGNKKGIYYLDTETNKLTFYENKIAPKFLSYKIDCLDKELFKKINNESKGNFVDISVDTEFLSKNASKFNKLFHKISEGSRTLNIFPVDSNLEEAAEETSSNLDTRDLIMNDVNKRFSDNKTKKKASKIVENLIKDI